nr:hypothetical protein [Tanacetum cinerariifolium]
VDSRYVAENVLMGYGGAYVENEGEKRSLSIKKVEDDKYKGDDVYGEIKGLGFIITLPIKEKRVGKCDYEKV